MRLPHRLRRVVATRPIVYWTVTIAVAAGTATVVQRATADAAETRHRWGDTRPTLVTLRAVGTGETLGPSNAEVRDVPLAVRPDGALDGLPAEPNRAVAVPLVAGEVVTAARLGRGGRSEVAGLLPEGTRGIAVAVPDGLPLQPGDTVDVIGPTGVVARGATVVRVGEQTAVVAVSAAEAVDVAAAGSDAVVVLAP
jgi:Flp pilus assembly protein CpaB